MKSSRLYTILFLVSGAVLVSLLAAIVILGNIFTGLGDGITTSHHVPVPLVLIPYAFFFICGAFATTTDDHTARFRLAIIAHLTPAISIFSAGKGNAPFMAFVLFGTFVLFVYPWTRLLRSTFDEPAADGIKDIRKVSRLAVAGLICSLLGLVFPHLGILFKGLPVGKSWFAFLMLVVLLGLPFAGICMSLKAKHQIRAVADLKGNVAANLGIWAAIIDFVIIARTII